MVDIINDPLVHMVRNAVDHGIEPPETRKKTGKSECGTVRLSAYHSAGNVVIEIKDDGKGLDCEAILAKARERGLVDDGASLSDREVFNLIFEPGFSTAEAVTEVSGRGVGMDVVKKNLEALRGQAEIQSETGQVSVFKMSLPLTLAIIDG
ncbi:MAG: chemotaxis protein CheA, partial [Deltaproteobacteria bacterium]|nr:chemotaxis protein CheA [Deltaproteobacteria bacterium]